MRMIKPLSAIAIGVVGLLGLQQAWASIISVTANIAFDTPITLTKVKNIQFGTVSALNASTYKITPAGVMTTVVGTGVALYGVPAAGDITIAGSTSRLLDISAGTYTANNGVTPSAATCAYNGGAAGSCTIIGAAAPGAGKTLLVGVDVTTSGTQAVGSAAAPTFDVTVIYQ